MLYRGVVCRVVCRTNWCRVVSCRVSVLCRVVLLCCVVLVGAECACCVGWCGLVWSVSCARVWSVSCTLVSSRSRIGWLVYRVVLCRVESCCVVSPCWTESYYVSCMYTVWFGRVTCRVVESCGLVWFGCADRFTNRTDRCRVVCSIGSAYERSGTRSGCV